MPETGSSDSNLYRPVCKEKLLRMAPSCRVHVAWVILPFIILLSLQIGFSVWISMRSDASAKPHITVVIDTNGTQRCTRSESEDRFPCIKDGLYISSDDPIGPLRCRDDAFAQSAAGGAASPDSCHGNHFRIASDGKGVVIPEDGMYRVYAKVTFFDRVNHHTTLSLRIDQPRVTECLGNHACLEARELSAHAWLSCYAHQPPAAANGTRDFANCALDGIRWFSAGEIVGLQVAIGYREISGHFKATYMYMHKL